MSVLNQGSGPIEDRLRVAIEAAREGGRATLDFFQSAGLRIDTKTDGTPVTAADKACETVIRERLASAFPEDGILGEEFGDAPGSTGFRWIIDPIDGTFSFMHAVPLYTTLIGIERSGGDNDRHTVAGVIYAPALDEMVHARIGGGAWHTRNGRDPIPAGVSDAGSLSASTVATTAPEYWDRSNLHLWHRLAERAAHTRGWPDAYGVMLVATGRCEAVIEPSLQVWDIAPFGPILAEAGGRSTDWSGRETAHSGEVVVSNGLVHDEILTVLWEG